ncbi:interleukin-12 subunit beta-like [Podarcis muralis]
MGRRARGASGWVQSRPPPPHGHQPARHHLFRAGLAGACKLAALSPRTSRFRTPPPLSVTGLEQPLQAPYWLLCLRRGPGSARCPAREVSASPGEVRLLLEDCSSPCPFGEKTELELALEGLGEDGSYEALRRDVAIQDIVKPDPPEKLTIHMESGAKLRLSWAPPASWHCASAYFPLRYRLKLEHYDGTQKEVSSDQLEETIKDAEAVHRAQIRCQDPFTNSMWSLWSPWVTLR